MEKELLEIFEKNSSKMVNDTVNKTLYHYTNLKGLEGILSSRRFFLTGYNYLNDLLEVEYSLDIIRKLIHKEFGKKDKFWNVFLDTFSQIVKKDPRYKWCIASFCTKEDYLPAW